MGRRCRIPDQTGNVGIDIEIGDTRQHPRYLPSVEAMPGRHEAELAVEFAQGRLWQALDQRLAVMSFGPFVSDQQMSPGLKATFECLAPGNPYRVGLYAPQSASRRRAISDGEISTIEGAEERGPERRLPMSLIVSPDARIDAPIRQNSFEISN